MVSEAQMFFHMENAWHGVTAIFNTTLLPEFNLFHQFLQDMPSICLLIWVFILDCLIKKWFSNSFRPHFVHTQVWASPCCLWEEHGLWVGWPWIQTPALTHSSSSVAWSRLPSQPELSFFTYRNNRRNSYGCGQAWTTTEWEQHIGFLGNYRDISSLFLCSVTCRVFFPAIYASTVLLLQGLSLKGDYTGLLC